MLVKMLHVPAPVRMPVKLQHQPSVRRWNPLPVHRPPLPVQGHKTGQLVCYPTRTTRQLTTHSIDQLAIASLACYTENCMLVGIGRPVNHFSVEGLTAR